MKKILVANIFGIGDVLFTTPLVSSLKKSLPGVSIDYIANRRVKEAIENNPDIDEVFVYEKDEFVKLWKRSKIDFFREMMSFLKNIRSKNYDVVFDFTMSRKSGLFFVLSGIKRRIGLNYKKRGVFLTDKISFKGFEGRHVVESYLDLVKFLGLAVTEKALKASVNAVEKKWADAYLKEIGLKNRLVAIVPGGGASWGDQAIKKRWTPEGFAAAADILKEKGYDIILLGDESEKYLCENILSIMKTRPLHVQNSLSLREYMALLEKCSLVLCNDGGPLHIAVALGVKTVSVFGPVDEKVYGPYPESDNHEVIVLSELSCRPCYNRFKMPVCEHEMKCLSGIGPEVVVKKCLHLLEKE